MVGEMEEIKEKFSKVYIDGCIISDSSKIDNFKEEEKMALKKLWKLSDELFYTSEKTRREIEKHRNLKKREDLISLYNLIKKVPKKNIIKLIPATLNSVKFNETTFNGHAEREDMLLTKLKQIFEKDDAEHIFQAEKNNLDYFLTLDKKTILNRVRERQDQLKKIGLNIKIVSPSQLCRILKI